MMESMELHSATPNEQGRDEKRFLREQQLETVVPAEGNIVYEDADHEPELHYKTYIALGAMFLLNLVNTFSIFSPPVAVSHTDIQCFYQAH